MHERYGLSLRKPKKWQRTDWMEASKRDVSPEQVPAATLRVNPQVQSLRGASP